MKGLKLLMVSMLLLGSVYANESGSSTGEGKAEHYDKCGPDSGCGECAVGISRGRSETLKSGEEPEVRYDADGNVIAH